MFLRVPRRRLKRQHSSEVQQGLQRGEGAGGSSRCPSENASSIELSRPAANRQAAMLRSPPHSSVPSLRMKLPQRLGASRGVPRLGCFVAQVRRDHRKLAPAVFGWSTQDQTRVERNGTPLVFLALGGTVHAGRQSALLKRILVDHDDQISLLIHVKRFLKEGARPNDPVLPASLRCGRARRSQRDIEFSPPAGARIPQKHGEAALVG